MAYIDEHGRVHRDPPAPNPTSTGSSRILDDGRVVRGTAPAPAPPPVQPVNTDYTPTQYRTRTSAGGIVAGVFFTLLALAAMGIGFWATGMDSLESIAIPLATSNISTVYEPVCNVLNRE